MTTDTGSSYELALGEGDHYAATFASILESARAALEDADDDFVIEEPDF